MAGAASNADGIEIIFSAADIAARIESLSGEIAAARLERPLIVSVLTEAQSNRFKVLDEFAGWKMLRAVKGEMFQVMRDALLAIGFVDRARIDM